MINPFAALFLVQPSNPAIQEAAARHMIAAHKGPKPVWRPAKSSNPMGVKEQRLAAIKAAHMASQQAADDRRKLLAPTVLEMRKQQIGIKSICRKLGLSKVTVYRIIEEANA